MSQVHVHKFSATCPDGESQETRRMVFARKASAKQNSWKQSFEICNLCWKTKRITLPKITISSPLQIGPAKTSKKITGWPPRR